jgi:hypothetical protein
MRFRLDVVSSESSDGWDATLQPLGEAQGRPWAGPLQRRLGRAQVGALGLPMLQPAAGLAPSRPGEKPLASAAEVAQTFKRLSNQVPNPGDLPAFGRYLFELLLGAEFWKPLLDCNQQDPHLELELHLRGRDTDMARLPWEAMHDGEEFLIQHTQPFVSLTRVITDAPQGQLPQLELPLNVLFVIGAPLKDKQLQPGAEYLGLLRSLRTEGLWLRSRLVLEANSEKLEQEVKDFEPAVVHVIGHGGMDANGGYLELMPNPGSATKDKVYAPRLAELLCPEGLAPPMLVLNTCYSTAHPELVQQAMPLAVELIQRGFPLVVGMGGRVADTACRFFTKGFYRALVEGASLASAVALGRRAGLKHASSDPDAVDWALPTLVMPPMAHPTLPVRTKPPAYVMDATRNLRMLDRPQILCDRLDFFTAYQELRRADVPKVLAIRVRDPSAAQRECQFGMSRLIQEIAVQALDDGFLPCLLSADEHHQPAHLLAVVEGILDAARDTAVNLGFSEKVEQTFFEFDKLKMLLGGNKPPVAPAAAVDKLLLTHKPPDHPQVLRTALRIDLGTLEQETRRQPLVLVDGAHWFGEVAGFLGLLKPQGLGEGTRPLPVIFTCSVVGTAPAAIKRDLESFFKEKSGYVRVMDLAALADDEVERQLVYQQFLLGWSPPLVINRRVSPREEKDFLDSLHDEVRGIPSFFEAIRPMLNYARKRQVVVEANDEDFLKAWKQQGGT